MYIGLKVKDIADYFNIDIVPVAFMGTIQNAVNFIKTAPLSIVANELYTMEGVVGRPMEELQDRTGKRIICKIKVRDFE